MFSNYAPENLNDILDAIINESVNEIMNDSNNCDATTNGEQNEESNQENQDDQTQEACIVELKVLAAWLFQDDALKTMHSADVSEEQKERAITKVASNPHLHSVLLEQLSEHSSPAVRTAVAEHEYASTEVLEKLSKDDSISVRYAIARNAGTSMQILGMLAEDDNPYVSTRAQKSVEAIEMASKPAAPVVNLNHRHRFRTKSNTKYNMRAVSA